jgi:hypothetical protein
MLQFSSFTITSTGSLKVPDGLVIRVSGNVTISGAIVVAPNTFSGYGNGGNSCFPGIPPIPTFGVGPLGLPAFQARLLLRAPSSSYILASTNGGTGTGGRITILAGGSITISSTGSISAPGPNGTAIPQNGSYYVNSAGAGGIIVLGSRTSISNAGSLAAPGGNGSDGAGYYSAGGGGGGGIVHLLAPSVSAGTVKILGGVGGANGIPIGTGGSAAGGACGGAGGNSDATGGPGGTGYVFSTIVAEPTSLFVP